MSNPRWFTWQQEFQHGMILIYPPDEIRAAFNPIRERYCPIAASYSETHISVTQPFIKAPTDDDWEQLAAIVARFDPFTIHYGNLSAWGQGRIIFFQIHPVGYINVIRDALHATGLFDLNRPFTTGFIPHLSLVESYADGDGIDTRTAEAGQAIYQRLRPMFNGGSFPCTEFVYLLPDEEFRFHVKRRLPFASH